EMARPPRVVPFGKSLFTGTDSWIQIVDLQTGTLLRTHIVKDGYSREAALVRDGVAYLPHDKQLTAFDVMTGKKVWDAQVGSGSIEPTIADEIVVVRQIVGGEHEIIWRANGLLHGSTRLVGLKKATGETAWSLDMLALRPLAVGGKNAFIVGPAPADL